MKPAAPQQRIEVTELRKCCPLPELLRKMGLGRHAGKSSKSPLRREANASWSVKNYDGRWYWKDFGTDESGDEIAFLAQYHNLDPKEDYVKLLKLWKAYWLKATPPGQPATEYTAVKEHKGPPNRSGFRAGSEVQIKRLSMLRGICVEALNLATAKGHLVFGNWYGQECFGLTDSSGRVLELRRLDGKKFPAFGPYPEHKSHAVGRSQKSWPVGILEATNSEVILLTEGVPDFLAAYQICLVEGSVDRVAPVLLIRTALPTTITNQNINRPSRRQKPKRSSCQNWDIESSPSEKIQGAKAEGIEVVDHIYASEDRTA